MRSQVKLAGLFAAAGIVISAQSAWAEDAGGFRFADDYIFMGLQSSTQWDALAHVYYDEQYYNGFPASGTTVKGGSRCTIDRQAAGIAGRGVLLDIAGLHGVDWLETGVVITPEDLDAACAAQNVSVGAGDILLFRTGWRRKFPPTAMPRRSWPASPALASGAVNGCANGTWRRSVRTTGRSRYCPVRCRGCVAERAHDPDPGHGHVAVRDPRPRAADRGLLADGSWEFRFVAPAARRSAGPSARRSTRWRSVSPNGLRPVNPPAIK